MKYTKPPLTLDDQVRLLQQRGLAGDPALMKEQLAVVSYYRLSAYWYPFRQPDGANPGGMLDSFKSGTTFDAIWNRYVFDRRLRLLVMDAIERIEIAVRTQLAYHHSHAHGAFAYADDLKSLPNLRSDQHQRFCELVNEQFKTSKETFVEHFRTKYGDSHSCLPVWMAAEVMTFGCMLTFHRGCSHDIRREIAKPFGVHDKVFDSWLLSLNTIRNVCAHHGRLWNRELGVKPKIPNKDKQWHAPVSVGNDRLFGILTICKYCMDRIAPQSGWPQRVRSLLDGSPDIPLRSMGFPQEWDRCPIWRMPA